MINRSNLKKFKKAKEKAEKRGEQEFRFMAITFDVKYAKYLIEYLEND